MAARLLRLSSFKGLQADRWGLLRSPSAASFCTKTEDPTKPGKKKKAAVKTDAPHLRESLLAYKSTVGFPVRTPQPAVLLTNMGGGAESAGTASSSPAVETQSDSSYPAQVVADGASPPAEEAGGEQGDAAAVPAAATDGAPTPESGDPAACEMSSSSDSESDSDSDSDNEKSVSAGPASAEPPRSSAEEEEHPQEVTGGQAEGQREQEGTATTHVEKSPHDGSGGSEKAQPPNPTSPQTPAEEAQKVDEEVLKDDAPAVSADVSEAPPPSVVQAADVSEAPPTSTVQAATINEAPPPSVVQAADVSEAPPTSPVQAADMSEAPHPSMVQAATINEAPPPLPVQAADVSEAPPPPPAQAAVEHEVRSSGPADHPVEERSAEPSATSLDGAEAIEEPAEPQNLSAGPPESQASSPAGVSEGELVDPGPVLDGAGELQLEEAAAPEPEPEEPFDNTTYKNYQHHSYNPYTFADLDLEMAKYRLPQPSSGRPSPQH